MQLFFTSTFAQIALSAYDVLWNAIPRDETEHQLLQPEHLTAIRFYDYIRLRAGEKIQLLTFVELGISIDDVFTLFNLIYLKQGREAIYMDGGENDRFIVYSQNYTAIP